MAGTKSTTFQNDLLKLIFNGVAITGVAQADGPTDLFLSLHTADPVAGNQTTNEVSYTGYTRATCTRIGGWTISGNSVSPGAAVSWTTCTGGTATATHVGIGTALTGTGKLLYSGALSPSISIATGVTPQLSTSATITET